MTEQAGTDFAMLGLGMDAGPAEEGARRFKRAGEQVGQTTREMQRELSVLEKAFQAAFAFNVGTDIYHWIKRIAASIPAAVAEVTRLNARYAELGVVLEVVGARAGYSMGQLRELERSLQRTGVSMLQSRQSILSMIQAHLDLSQATKLARAAQDVAVVGQMNSSEALQRMTHGIVSGQTEILRTMGIMVNFEAAYKRTAREIGVSTGALTEQQKVQTRLNEVMKQAATLTGAYEASMTSASKQLRSTERYVEDLKVRVGAVFAPAYTQLVFAYADALKGAAHWVEQNDAMLTRWANNLAQLIHGAITAVRSLGQEFAGLHASIMVIDDFVAILHHSVQVMADLKNAPQHAQAVVDRYQSMQANAQRVADRDRAARETWETARYERSVRQSPGTPTNPWSARPSNPLFTGSTGNLGSYAQNGVFQVPFAAGPTVRPTAAANAGDPPAGPTDEMIRRLKAARDAAKDYLFALGQRSELEQFEHQLGKVVARLREAGASTAEITRVTTEARAEWQALQERALKDDIWRGANKNKEALRDMAGEVTQRHLQKSREELERLQAVQRAMQAAWGEIGSQETKNLLARNPGALKAYTDVEARGNYARARMAEGIEPQEAMRMANAWGRANEEAERLKATTSSWGDRLRDVGQLVGGIATLFGQLPERIRQAAQGTGQLLAGVGTLFDAAKMKNKAGQSVGLMGALQGEAGAAGVLASVSGFVAVAGGVVQLMDAVDLFGRKAREEARLMRDAAAEAVRSLADFRLQTQSGGGLSDSLRSMQNQLAEQVLGRGIVAAYGPKAQLAAGVQFGDYLNPAAAAQFRAQAGQSLTSNGEDLLQAVRNRRGATVMADLIEEMLQAVAERARAMAPQVLASIDRAFNTATGNDTANSLLDAADAWSAANRDLMALFQAGALSAADYEAALAKTEATRLAITQKIEARALEEQRRTERANGDWARSLDVRLLAAQGDTQGASMLQEMAADEAELAEARAAGRDVTRLLTVQEAERAQRQRERLIAERAQLLDDFARGTALTNGSIAGSLAQKAADVQKRIDAAPDRDRADIERRLGLEELAQMRQQYRQQAEASLLGYRLGATKDSVQQAQLQGTMAIADAQKTLTEYLNAGIITLGEYTTAVGQVTQAAADAVTQAERARVRTQLGFQRDLAGLMSELDPENRQLAKQAYDAEGNAAYREAYDAALQLKEAGDITASEFDQFAALLTQKFSPAVRDAAWAVQEAARTMEQNLSTLNQQWGVFGASAQEQLSDLTALFGFGGKSKEEVQALFTKMTPGQELTSSQVQVNQQIAQWMQAWNRANPQSTMPTDAATMPNTPWQPTAPTTTYVAQYPTTPAEWAAQSQTWAQMLAGQDPMRQQPEGLVLDSGEVQIRQTQNITSVEALTLADLGASQLTVQRQIARDVAALRAVAEQRREPTASSGWADADDESWGREAGYSALLTGGVPS
jgi:hypothetical protein